MGEKDAPRARSSTGVCSYDLMLMVGVLLEMFGLVGSVYALTCTPLYVHPLAVSALILTKIIHADIGSIATVMVLGACEVRVDQVPALRYSLQHRVVGHRFACIYYVC